MKLHPRDPRNVLNFRLAGRRRLHATQKNGDDLRHDPFKVRKGVENVCVDIYIYKGYGISRI